MPSRESVSEETRARKEFTTAVRKGIEALMSRCGFSRERATMSLLKELNRGNGPESKPTDDEVFGTMRRYNLGLDVANRAIVVSRAMKRELLSREGQNATNPPISPTEAIQRLTLRLSLDKIMYESGEDDSDDDGQNEIPPLKIPKVSRVPSSASINLSSSSSITSSNNTPTHLTSSSRKHARSKKNSSPSPRKQMKTTIIVGRKRSIEEMDSTKQSSDVETKAATGRPQLRVSKRLHRSSASTEASVTSTNK